MVLGDLVLADAARPRARPGVFDFALELPDFLACGDHVGVLVGIFQAQRIEIAAQLLQAALIRAEGSPARDDDLRCAIDAQQLRDRSDLFAQRVAPRRRVVE